MKEFFKELCKYNQLVNDITIQKLHEYQDQLPTRITVLMSHILWVHQSWNQRMIGESGLANLWERFPAKEWSSANTKNTDISLALIEEKGLEETFSYTNSKGAQFTNRYRDVLFHLINHSTYHRGQLNLDLRLVGLDPVNTEYIFYKR